MVARKFKTGQRVTFVGRSNGSNIRGTFEIVRLLPFERGVWQYRIKSTLDGHERVVTEAEVA